MAAINVPIITAGIIDRNNKIVSAGQTVLVGIEVKKNDFVTGRQLLDPTEVPTATIYNPSGTALVTDQVMTKQDTGVYAYSHLTVPGQTLGMHTGSFNVVHNDVSAILGRVGLFVLERTSTFATFSYLAIQDQSNVVWYWYLDVIPALTSVVAIPSDSLKLAVDVTPTVTPHWLQIDNTSAATRYVYPDVMGDALVVTSAPAVGTGKVGSPTFVALDGSSYTLGVNLSDEVIIVSV